MATRAVARRIAVAIADPRPSSVRNASRSLPSHAKPAVSRRKTSEVARGSQREQDAGGSIAVKAPADVPGMQVWLNSLKYNDEGLVVVIVQHVDTGEILMQAYADQAALSETLQTGLATFYSRSRKERWCKGETSGNYISVKNVFTDCDRDSIIYLGDPDGPSCHTGARCCWFAEVERLDGMVISRGHYESDEHTPLTTLPALERVIVQRRDDMESGLEAGGKPSWTSRLLSNRELLCRKVREEADELCRTLEEGEGKARTASEMADLLYHSLVLLNVQGVTVEEVLRTLRSRFGVSGVEEKASRKPKDQQLVLDSQGE